MNKPEPILDATLAVLIIVFVFSLGGVVVLGLGYAIWRTFAQ